MLRDWGRLELEKLYVGVTNDFPPKPRDIYKKISPSPGNNKLIDIISPLKWFYNKSSEPTRVLWKMH